MPRPPSGRTEHLHLRLKPETKQRLADQATHEGTTPAELGARVVERYVHPPDDLQQTADRLEALKRRQVADASESQELVDQLLERHVQIPFMAPSG